MSEDIKRRVNIREPKLQEDLLNELVTTAKDRIVLYSGVEDFPEVFNSICVEIVLAMYRRSYHEGIKSEKADVFDVQFVDDLLGQYDREFKNYLASLEDSESTNASKVKFI